jgi:hypothetical protein
MLGLSLDLIARGSYIQNGFLHIPLEPLGFLPTDNPTGEQILVAINRNALIFFGGKVKTPDNKYIVDKLGRKLAYANRNKYSNLEMFLWTPFRENRDGKPIIRLQIVFFFYEDVVYD